MRAMVMTKQGSPLQLQNIAIPEAQTGELLIRVSSCGICRTDLHVMDGDLKQPILPLVLGHQIVGKIEAVGEGVTGFTLGQRVGVPWLGGSCGDCDYCVNGQENLCDDAVYTGYQKMVDLPSTQSRMRTIASRFHRHTPICRRHRCFVLA